MWILIENFVNRKLVLIAFIAICFASCAKADLIDDGIYGAINAIVNVKYREKPEEERKCIQEKFRSDNIAEKFSRDLLYDHKKLQQEMEPYFSGTETYCEWFVFVKSPLGICLVVGILLMILSILVALCKCICC